MTMQEMIEHYSIQIVMQDGIEMLGAYRNVKKITPEDTAFVKANKEEIIAHIKAEQAAREKESDDLRAATVTFWAHGWETRKLSIDTRKDIDDELRRLAAYYSNDYDYESLKRDYTEQIQRNKEEAARKMEKERTEKEAEEKALRLAAETQKKQEIRHWTEDCNDPREECSMDVVTLWAMPDGTITQTREHTW